MSHVFVYTVTLRFVCNVRIDPVKMWLLLVKRNWEQEQEGPTGSVGAQGWGSFTVTAFAPWWKVRLVNKAQESETAVLDLPGLASP